MTERTLLDRLHARAQGWLTRAELEALERELAADPSLQALAEDYRLVHLLTAADPLSSAGSRTSFDELAARLERPGALPRRAAAAAAVLLLALGGFWAGWRLRPVPAPLYLRAIELDEPFRPAREPADLPGELADYDPRGEGGVRFLSSLADAELLARMAQRPLLVYGTYPGCPMAAALDARVFSDPRVIALAERTVPVRIDLARLPQAEQDSFVKRGYPFLEVWREDGRTAHSLVRLPDPQRFVESLHDGLAASDAVGEQPSWEELQGTARAFVAARAAELEGRLADAERGFRALAGSTRAPAPIAERAAAALRRMADGARVLLLEARATAQGHAGEAENLLEHALERYAGTSFEPDLRAALERLRRDGRFPALAEADGSA